MNENSEILKLRDTAKNQLLQIRTVEDGISYLNKLKTLETWVQAEKKDAELQNLVAEHKLRTQRLLGELIPEAQRKGMMADKEDNLKTGPELPEGKVGKKTLAEYGLSWKQSSMFQAIASMPMEKFENFIQEKRDAEITTAGALRFAKTFQHANGNGQETEDDVITEPEVEEISIEDKLQDLARHIKSTYTTEQIALLIQMIK